MFSVLLGSTKRQSLPSEDQHVFAVNTLRWQGAAHLQLQTRRQRLAQQGVLMTACRSPSASASLSWITRSPFISSPEHCFCRASAHFRRNSEGGGLAFGAGSHHDTTFKILGVQQLWCKFAGQSVQSASGSQHVTSLYKGAIIMWYLRSDLPSNWLSSTRFPLFFNAHYWIILTFSIQGYALSERQRTAEQERKSRQRVKHQIRTMLLIHTEKEWPFKYHHY